MKKCTYAELEEIFGEHNRNAEAYDNPMYAVIIIKDFGNGQNYKFKSRCYVTASNTSGWDYSKAGRCKIGSCTDGSETIRLDWYLDEGLGSWKIENCYIVTESFAKKFMK